MAKFDPNKMESVKKIVINDPENNRKYVVEAYSYDGGPVKVGLKMMVKRKDAGWIFARKVAGMSDRKVAVKVGKAIATLATKYL